MDKLAVFYINNVLSCPLLSEQAKILIFLFANQLIFAESHHNLTILDWFPSNIS